MTNNEANFVFGNMNSRGCGERLTLASMIAALNTAVKSFDLTTINRPKIAWLDESFGTKLSSVMRKLRRIYIISILYYLEKSNSVSNHYSKRGFVTINTRGDKIPYYNPGMTKDNSIVYCHYPTARGLIQRRDLEYLENDLNIRTMKKITVHLPINYAKIKPAGQANMVKCASPTRNVTLQLRVKPLHSIKYNLAPGAHLKLVKFKA